MLKTIPDKRIFDTPYQINNIRLHSSGAIAIFGQRTVHFYDVTYEPIFLYSICWVVIVDGTKETNNNEFNGSSSSSSSSSFALSKEKWIEQRQLRDVGISIVNVEWISSSSAELYTVILFSNKTFVIVKKGYDTEGHSQSFVGKLKLKLNRQEIHTDSMKLNCEEDIIVINTLKEEKANLLFTVHEGKGITIWEIVENTAMELVVNKLRVIEVTISIQWLNVWKSNAFPSHLELLGFDSSKGLFEHHLISVDKQSSQVDRIETVKILGNEVYSGIQIINFTKSLNNTFLILCDTKILQMDIDDESITSLKTSHLLRYSFLCLSDSFLYTYNTRKIQIEIFSIDLTAKEQIQFFDCIACNENIARALGACTDPMNTCLLVCYLEPPTDDTRESQLNYNLSYPHLQFSVLPLLPKTVDTNEGMTNYFFQIIYNKLNYHLDRSLLFFPLALQGVIDYRFENMMDVLIPTVDPIIHEAIAFGEKNPLNSRYRKRNGNGNDEEEEEDEEEDEEDDELLGPEAELLDQEPMETDDIPKKSKSAKPKPPPKPTKSKAKGKEGIIGSDFVLNTIYKSCQENFGLDCGTEYRVTINLFLQAAIRWCIGGDEKDIIDTSNLDALLELPNEDPLLQVQKIELWKLLHATVSLVIKFNKLKRKDYPWLLEVKRRVGRYHIDKLLQNKPPLLDEPCIVCETPLKFDSNEFRYSKCNTCDCVLDRCCYSLKIVNILKEYKLCRSCSAIVDFDVSYLPANINCPYCNIRLIAPW